VLPGSKILPEKKKKDKTPGKKMKETYPWRSENTFWAFNIKNSF